MNLRRCGAMSYRVNKRSTVFVCPVRNDANSQSNPEREGETRFFRQSEPRVWTPIIRLTRRLISFLACPESEPTRHKANQRGRGFISFSPRHEHESDANSQSKPERKGLFPENYRLSKAELIGLMEVSMELIPVLIPMLMELIPILIPISMELLEVLMGLLSK